MADKFTNTTGVGSSTFDGSLDKDINGLKKQPNQWTHARNAVPNTIKGDLGDISNEPANKKCIEAPYTIIGTIHIEADNWVIFSTDNINSEIGLFIESECSYKKIVNDTCLNFNTENLIIGVGRTAYDCGRRVYWDDGNNPTRILDIDNVPWIQDNCTTGPCHTCEDTDQLDCEKIRLAPIVKDLAFKVKQGTSAGEIINGSYYVVGAYLVEGQRVTDYSAPSNIQGLFTHENLGSSLDIYIKEADTEFDEFELILVQFANFNTVAKKIGVYSTHQKKITLDNIQERWANIDPSLLLIRNSIPDKSQGFYRNGDYTLRIGPTSKFDFNYQPLANQIRSKWVSVEYDAEYYRNGGSNTGYMRDEVYSYFIRWVWNTGDKTNSYHIPGRNSTPYDTQLVTGDDITSNDTNQERWKIYNTAGLITVDPLIGQTLDDGGRVLAVGKMSYWESSELYPDNKPNVWNASSDVIWGTTNPHYDLCGKPIRHHKFPDNAIQNNLVTNHYDPVNGDKIRVMAIAFENIKPPLDNEGNLIEGIVGYEILRGSREGNKTILAKGIINNMREYISRDINKKYLYPNYPYNPFSVEPRYGLGRPVDHFLSSLHTSHENDQLSLYGDAYLENDVPLGMPSIYPDGSVAFSDTHAQQYGNIKLDLLTFHSPETNFRNPFLSSKILKIYGEVNGAMRGNFELPKGHGKHKFITDKAFLMASLIGIGYALMSTEGKKTTKYITSSIDYGGTQAQVGTSTGSTGLIGPSIVPSLLQAGSVGGSRVGEFAVNQAFSYSGLSLIFAAFGQDANTARMIGLETTGFIAGSIGGRGGTTETTSEATPWAATPFLIRTIAGLAAFLTYWAEGIDTILEIVYSFTTPRHYALQQVSHCFYDTFKAPVLGSTRRAVEYQNYLNPNLQDFAKDFRINNIYRSRTVALKIEENLNLPTTIDNTQAIYSEIHPRANISEWQNEDSMMDPFERTASSHYVALKQILENQYGQLDGIIQVPVSTDHIDKSMQSSPVLFNGDTYIGRYTEKNTMFFFYDWLNGQPDGYAYNYKLRKMITHPRFWMDTDKYDVGEFVSSLGDFFGNSNTPSGFDPLTPATSNDVCECDDNGTTSTSNCMYQSSDLDRYCQETAKAEHHTLYKEFLDDCACYKNTNHEPGCNEDGDIPNPENEIEYDDCGPDCNNCPNWSGFLGSVSKSTGKYLEEQKGKWARKIRRQDRKIRRHKRRADKARDKVYDNYIDSLDGDQDTWWNNLFDAWVLPSDKYAFDQLKPDTWALTVKKAYMYLFVSGVRDFYVESEINIDYRDWGDPPEQHHYDHLNYTDLRQLFNSDIIKVGNFMKYDYSLSISKIFNNYISWGLSQSRQYDPHIAETCYIHRPKRIIYSLPQTLENKKDNWRVFLPLNYKDFNSVPTTIKPIAKNGALLLFETESPIQFIGVDQLETDGGTKITLGDGGLFSQPMQNIVNSDYPNEYGSCQNRLSVINTPHGLYYMSQNQGKIFQIMGQQGLRDISAMATKWWFAKYLPYKLTEHPTAFIDTPFELLDNPVIGIGCQAIYDNKNELIYFCKKDWVIRDDIDDDVIYLGGDLFQINKTLKVKLGDPAYFKNASWTALWDPKTNQGQGGWIGYHDWHPDLTLASKNTFMTTKDNGIWIHSDRCDLYCNYYGKDYPFEVEVMAIDPSAVNTLRNIIYLMEAYVYKNNCDDRFHVLDENFDEAIIYNTEQCSGLLKLNLSPKNNAPGILNFPIINYASIDILFSKEEQKYKFNQFWDITRDRGEFNTYVEQTIFNTEPNGYIRPLNFNNLDYNKNSLERKRFRHFKHIVLLRKTVSGKYNIIVSSAIDLTLKSPR